MEVCNLARHQHLGADKITGVNLLSGMVDDLKKCRWEVLLRMFFFDQRMVMVESTKPGDGPLIIQTQIGIISYHIICI